MKIPNQALNTRVYRRARGYFILVDMLPFISIPSCPLNFSWLCRATPDLHKGNVNSRQSLSCRSFPPLPLITQKSVYKRTKSTHSPVTTAHAITGRETQRRSTATHRLTGQIQYCNFITSQSSCIKALSGRFQTEKALQADKGDL